MSWEVDLEGNCKVSYRGQCKVYVKDSNLRRAYYGK